MPVIVAMHKQHFDFLTICGMATMGRSRFVGRSRSRRPTAVLPARTPQFFFYLRRKINSYKESGARMNSHFTPESFNILRSNPALGPRAGGLAPQKSAQPLDAFLRTDAGQQVELRHTYVSAFLRSECPDGL